MRERRKLAIARRQLMLAQTTRRSAIAALADALANESKSGALARRSQALLKEYSRPREDVDATSLRAQSDFARSLKLVASDAVGAHRDAQDQVSWQTDHLTRIQTKTSLVEEHLDRAKRDLHSALSRREQQLAAQLARKLLNP